MLKAKPAEATPEATPLIAPGTFQLKQANSFGQVNMLDQLGLGAVKSRSHTDSFSGRTISDTQRDMFTGHPARQI